MCGIAGFISRARQPEVLDAMLARIAHRGPDGEGRWLGEQGGWHIHLGHRRLSIIDIEGGRQPMGNEDGRLQITYNGELYNFKDLRAALAPRHHFATRSDTEVVVHHFEEHGAAGLSDLNGMFAFALWDGRSGALTLARDRPGIKPLYYAPLPDGGIAFASELWSLLRHPHIPKRISREGLLSYFFCDYALPPWSMVEGVKKLEPARSLTWRDGALSPSTPYWRLAPPPRASLGSEEELAEELWGRLRRAVERQMVADVPVGVFLSGGLDSSTVAELARECTPGRLRTFSIGFEMKSFDESDYARLVARHIGSDHTEEIAGERTLLESLDTVLESLDEPLADHSYLPTYLLSRLAARSVKVVLGGDGGDELWAGYPTYKAHAAARVYALMPRAVRDDLAPRLVAKLPVTTGYQALDFKIRRFVGRWDDAPLRRHFRWLSSIDLPDLPRALPFSRGALPPPLRVDYPPFRDPLNALLAVDFSSYMHASVLTKVDRASMAHSLEVRPPLLDNEHIDWAFSLPDHFKLRRATTKYLFKRAARPHLPPEIVDRPKRGFGIPLIAWLRGPLRGEIDRALDDSILWESDLLDRAVFRGMRDSHLAGAADASKPLWALIVLSRWIRREGIQS